MPRPSRGGLRPDLGLIGAGAFGAFAASHLAPFFDVAVHDPRPDLTRLCAERGVCPASLETAAARRVVVVAVPLAALRGVARKMAAHLRPDALVVDVCSVKVRPLAILREALPPGMRLVGTHPLFGPNSGRAGIEGLKVAVCEGGRDGAAVARFLAKAMRLQVVRTTAEAHDREMAYVQALSHLVARSMKRVSMPALGLKTAAFARLEESMNLIGDDSAALFETIAGGNPFAPDVLNLFLESARALLDGATCGGDGR